MPLEPRIVQTPNAPAAIGPYSQAISSRGLVYVSGQIGIDPHSGAIPENFTAQTKQALANLRAILEAAGSGLGYVISVDVYLTDMARFSQFNELYAAAFQGHRPARAVVGVHALPREAQVEVRCVATLAG